MKYTIDARGKKVGRIASEAAKILLGKNSPSFAKNIAVNVKVEIVNAKDTDITALKKEKDTYVTYTGFRGGLKTEKLGDLILRKGMKEVYERAVYNMLPKNKLRDVRMSNLIVKE
jgi:large subunit ribosomal protein L13